MTEIISYNIYFICKGTSTNDIINSVNKTFEKKKYSLSNYFWGKKPNNSSNNNTIIELDDYSPLEEIGIKEMYMCKDNINNNFRNIFGYDDYYNRLCIYTPLDQSSIESGLILIKGSPNRINIKPLPYMISNKKINSKNVRIFIELFGNIFINTHNELNRRNIIDVATTDPTQYWSTKKLNFVNIGDQINGEIDWMNIIKNDKNLSYYNLDKFKNIFKDNFLSEYTHVDELPTGGNRYYPDANVRAGEIDLKIPIIIADYNLIYKLLKQISSKQSKLYEIEKGSIWKVEVDIIFKYNLRGDIIKKDIKYKNFIKKYPIESNHSPLKFINNRKFKYEFNGMTYLLFNAQNEIPLEFLKHINLLRFNDEYKKLAILKAIEIYNKKKQNEKSKNKLTNTLVNESVTTVQTFSFDSQ